MHPEGKAFASTCNLAGKPYITTLAGRNSAVPQPDGGAEINLCPSVVAVQGPGSFGSPTLFTSSP